MLACEGRLQGAVAVAPWNVVPSVARAFRTPPESATYSLATSYRSESRTTRTTVRSIRRDRSTARMNILLSGVTPSGWFPVVRS